MPRNLELKARIRSLRGAVRIAGDLGARRAGVLDQVDSYFGGVKGIRLKMREVRGDAGELILYRRPNRRGARLSEYSKIPMQHPAPVRRMLAAAFGVSAVVRKRRTVFLYRNARIHIDRVAGLGTFLEFEVMVTKGRRQAEKLMDILRNRFDVRSTMLVSSSYSDLPSSHRKGR